MDQINVPADYVEHTLEYREGYEHGLSSSPLLCPYNSPSNEGAAWYAGYYAAQQGS